MNIYDKYPMMEPFKGSEFDKSSKPSLLLVGESHYFPKNSSNHVGPDIWYSGIANKLNEKEIKWISTSKIIEESKKEDFKIRSHSIWKKPFKIINEYGPSYQDYSQVADNIAFCNFFLRPAREGDSLNIKPQDITVANATFLSNYQKLNPTGIVFLSRLAYKYFNLHRAINVPTIATPHPGCSWWNRKTKKYDNRKGNDILRDFIKTLQW